jgi:hypothetical protein
MYIVEWQYAQPVVYGIDHTQNKSEYLIDRVFIFNWNELPL